RHGLRPILCVGESLEVRESGRCVEHVCTQLDGGLKGVSAAQVSTVVLAYEPIWAIGTGQVATPDDAEQVCAALRARLAESYSAEAADDMRILYGGSVKGSNAADLLAQANIDGALVGGASLDAAEFAAICAAASEIAWKPVAVHDSRVVHSAGTGEPAAHRAGAAASRKGRRVVVDARRLVLLEPVRLVCCRTKSGSDYYHRRSGLGDLHRWLRTAL